MDSNEWWGLTTDTIEPELYVSETDEALQYFFDSCFLAGEEQCALWSAGGPGEIQSRFDAVVDRLRQRPISLPLFGLLEYPIFRSGVFTALYSPDTTFSILARVTAELEKERPSQALTELLQLFAAPPPREKPLVDPESGLSNGFEALYIIWCGDKPRREANVTEELLLDIVADWQSVSDLGGEEVSPLAFFCQRE